MPSIEEKQVEFILFLSQGKSESCGRAPNELINIRVIKKQSENDPRKNVRSEWWIRLRELWWWR